MRQAPGADSARLFVALWPPAGVRAALAAAAGQWAWNMGAVPVPPERLHVTLHFLGAVARERVPELRTSLALPFTPFALTLSRPALWSGGIAVLEPARIPPALAELHAALGATLQRSGLAAEKRPWRAHLTLARRAAGAKPPVRCALPCWRVNGFALVESCLPKGYTLLQRYHAPTAGPLERSQREGSAAGVE